MRIRYMRDSNSQNFFKEDSDNCNRSSVFDFYISHYQTLKTDLTLNKVDILRLKVTKMLRILRQKFCESRPSFPIQSKV
jgi:hypothetical protein